MATLEDDARFQEDAPPTSLKLPPDGPSDPNRPDLRVPGVGAVPNPNPPDPNNLPPFQIPGMGPSSGVAQLLQSIPQLQQQAPQLPKMGGGVQGSPIGLSLPSLGLPQVPRPAPVPEPPKAKYSDPLTALGEPLTALSLIASAFTRRPAVTAMRSLASGMKALREGDQIKYQNDYREYEQALQKAHMEQTQEQIDYKRDWENRRLSIQEKQAKMRGTATRRGDSAMLAYLDSGGDPGTLLDDRAKAGLPITAALEKTAAIKKLMKENPGMDYATAQARYTADKAKKLLEAKTGTGQAGDPSLHGDEYLGTLPPLVADTVRAIAEGRQPLPAGKWGEQLREMAFHYKPELRGQTYGGRAAAERSFGGGKAADNVTALNTVMGHIGALSESAKGLNNSAWRTGNKLLNKYLEETGDPRVARFLTDAHAVAAELGRVFKGTVTEGEIKRQMELIDSSRSPAQLKAQMQEFAKLIRSRINSMEDTYKRTTGRDSAEGLLTPHSREVLDQLEGGSTAAPETGTVMDGYRFKGGDPAEKSNWEKAE